MILFSDDGERPERGAKLPRVHGAVFPPSQARVWPLLLSELSAGDGEALAARLYQLPRV